VVASGRYHRSVRSVDLARLKDSFPVSFSVAFWGLFIRTFFFFLDLSPSRRRALAQAAPPLPRQAATRLRRRLLAPHLAPAPPCPCPAAPPQPPRARSRASRPGLARHQASRLVQRATACSAPRRPSRAQARRSIGAKAENLRQVILPYPPIVW